MKTLLIALFSCTALLAETKIETDLRKQLAAAKAETEAAEAHVKALQVGQKKLTDAVAVQTEVTQKTNEKIEAATDGIIKSEATGKKLVAAVESQAAATQSATKELAHEVKTQNAAVTTAITTQTKQQERALLAAREAAREVARKLEQSNVDRAAEKREDAARMDEMKKTLQDIKRQDELNDAKNKAAIIREALPVAATIVGSVCGLGVAVVGIFQIKAMYQAKAQLATVAKLQGETHTMVNGQREAAMARIKELEDQIAAKIPQSDLSKGIRP